MNDIYLYTIPIIVRSLGGLKTVLTKASAVINEKGMSESDLIESRLAPDMFPLVRQVQNACDNAKGATARLSGVEAPKFPDTEQTISELIMRIDKTLEFITSVPEASFASAATKPITFPYFPDVTLTGTSYVQEFVLPNFFFHVVTAYDILRKNGVPLKKADYLNNPHFKEPRT